MGVEMKIEDKRVIRPDFNPTILYQNKSKR